MSYDKQAVRTESPKFNTISETDLFDSLALFIAQGEELDAIKKAIFYGKNLERFQGQPELQVDRRMQRLIHGVLGIATEAVELVEMLFQRLTDQEPVDEIHLFEELGDVEWYMAILRDEFGFIQKAIQERNIAKLRARFPDKFSEEKAIDRDVAAERVVLRQMDGATFKIEVTR